VLNRGNARTEVLSKPGDYEAFERIVAQALTRVSVRLLAYCLMPNHWHLVLWPREDGDLSAFMAWLTMTHAQRWHAHRGTTGGGHLYQGRYKSFPIQQDGHFLTVCRYVERNSLRAGLVRRAEDWRWCSLWRREYGDDKARTLLSPWPVPPPRDWVQAANTPQPQAELTAVRVCVTRGRPYGSSFWQSRVAARLGLQSTLRPRGRPRNKGS